MEHLALEDTVLVGFSMGTGEVTRLDRDLTAAARSKT